jgi:hypothetical protein
MCRNIGINALGLLLCKLGNVIPILLQTVRNLVRRLRIAQLENRIIVHRPVLGLLIGAPDLFSFHAEKLHADAAWRRDIVWDELGSERGVAHDAVITGGFGEHALSKVGWEVAVYDEFANHALFRSAIEYQQHGQWTRLTPWVLR